MRVIITSDKKSIRRLREICGEEKYLNPTVPLETTGKKQRAKIKTAKEAKTAKISLIREKDRKAKIPPLISLPSGGVS